MSHGWDKPSPTEATNPNPAPISPETATRISTLEGPPEKTPEAKEPAQKEGFSCRNVLGELICACAIARLDIGCAVCLLARFSGTPHRDHCRALKQVCQCLQTTKSWGVIHWRPNPLDSLPDVPCESLVDDPELPPFEQQQAKMLTKDCRLSKI